MPTVPKVLTYNGDLLLRNNKLQRTRNIAGDVIAKEDCICCQPDICECPGGSYYAEQKRITGAWISIADLPSSYTEYQENSLGTANRTLTLTGLDGLNGTYTAALVNLGEVDCEQADSGCPFDDPKYGSCEWQITVPPVDISGSFTVTGGSGVTGYSINGWAHLRFEEFNDGSGTKQVPQILINCNVSMTSGTFDYLAKTALRSAFTVRGVRGWHDGLGFLTPYHRLDCTPKLQPFFGYGGNQLALICNGSQSFYNNTFFEPADTVLTAPIATCADPLAIWDSDRFQGSSIKTLNVPAGTMSASSCAAYNGTVTAGAVTYAFGVTVA